jgi:DNA-binding NarL/FixJ family response regulator
MSDSNDVKKTVTAIVVDDDELMRRAVRAALISLDCKVVGETYDGEEAHELYSETKPDLVLLDIRMPKMDGLEVLTKLTEVDEDAYVVMMTFMDDDDLVEDCMIAGAKDYLRKDMIVRI